MGNIGDILADHISHFRLLFSRVMGKLADESAEVDLFDVTGNYFRVALPVGHPEAISGIETVLIDIVYPLFLQ